MVSEGLLEQVTFEELPGGGQGTSSGDVCGKSILHGGNAECRAESMLWPCKGKCGRQEEAWEGEEVQDEVQEMTQTRSEATVRTLAFTPSEMGSQKCF